LHGRDEKCIQNLVRNWKEKRPRGNPRHKGVDNIKMDLGNRGCDDMNRFLWFRQRPMADSSGCSNKPLCSTRGREFIN
jgi:hypothetical protein